LKRVWAPGRVSKEGTHLDDGCSSTELMSLGPFPLKLEVFATVSKKERTMKGEHDDDDLNESSKTRRGSRQPMSKTASRMRNAR